MTKPWEIVDRVETDEGPMTLMRRGERDFVIRMQHFNLMSSAFHLSEAALGAMAIRAVTPRNNPRILIAGLGMGFTLRAALDELPAGAGVTVAELNPVVVEWCRGPMASLTNAVLDDPRLEVHVGDVAQLITRAGEKRSLYDAIILDLYQGTHDANNDPGHPFYGRAALERTSRALVENGIFAVWTEEPDRKFEERLKKVGFSVDRQRPGKGGPRHAVYLARKVRKPR